MWRAARRCLALALLVFAGCRTALQKGRWQAEIGGVRLLDGDVLVLASGDAVSAAFGWHPVYPGAYSHSGVYVTGPEGECLLMHLQGDRVRVMDVDRMLAAYYRVVAYRHRESLDGDPALAATARDWLERRAEVASVFDPKRTAADEPGYSCAGLVNGVYADAGLALPFALGVERPLAQWMAWYDRRNNEGLARLPNVNSIAGNRDFMPVAEYRHPDFSALREEVSMAVAASAYRYLAAGWELRPAPLASRAWLGCLLWLSPDHVELDALASLRGGFLHYARRVRRVCLILDERGQLPADPTARRAVIDRVCEELRDACFVYPENARPRPLS